MHDHEQAHFPPRGPEGRRRDRGAAAARGDGAGADGRSPPRRADKKIRFVAIEMVHGSAGSTPFGLKKNLWAPEAVGNAFDLSPERRSSPLEPFRDYVTIVSNIDVRNAEAFTAPEIGGDHFRSSAVFLTQSHPQADAGVRPPRRHLDRPDLREEVRPGHADPVDAALHRERGSGRRLLLRLFVRVHRLDQLGVARAAAADGARPARGVRSAVRRRRDAGRAQGTARGRSQHPRLARHVDQPLEEGSRRRRPRAPERLPGRRARDRAPHPEDRGAQQQRRAARAAGRADRRARLLLRARQADVRSAGARVRLGHHPRLRVQARTRRLEPRLPGERLQGRVPLRVAPPGEGRARSWTSRRSTGTTSAWFRISSRS